MFRFYVIALLFGLSGSLLAGNMISGEVNNQQIVISTLSLSIGKAPDPDRKSNAIVRQKHAELMPTSMAVLLIAVGFALVFLDDHLKKAKNRKK